MTLALQLKQIAITLAAISSLVSALAHKDQILGGAILAITPTPTKQVLGVPYTQANYDILKVSLIQKVAPTITEDTAIEAETESKQFIDMLNQNCAGRFIRYGGVVSVENISNKLATDCD